MFWILWYNSPVMNKFSLIIVVLVVGFAGLIYMAASSRPTVEDIDPQTVLQVREDDFVRGDPYSPVVLVEYADYECPACRAYHPLLNEVVEKYGGKIAIVNRHFPLPFHKNSRTAAWAVEAAGKQGQFKEMADLVFERQDEWSGNIANISLFYPYAEQLGLDMDQFKTDAVSQDIKDKVDRHYLEGQAIGVNATPTFYLQGEKLGNLRSIEEFSALIDAEIIKMESVKDGEKIHEHADIKVFINRKQFDLGLDKYQSTDEVQLHPDIHLHDGNGEMVHLHWSGITISDFFASLGMDLNSSQLSLDTGEVYVTGGNGVLTIWADEQVVDPVTYLVEDLDRLLVSYGDPADVPTQWLAVKDEACIYSELCPERGEAPTESCVGGLGSSCNGGKLSE